MWIRRVLAAAAGLALAATLVPAVVPAVADEVVTPRPIVSGWLYQWSVPPADNVAVSNLGVTPEVNVFWWFFDGSTRPLCTFDPSDGSCITSSPSNVTLRGIRDSLHARNIKVFATITDMQPSQAGKLSKYISTVANQKIYADKIAAAAVAAGVDGVDLDWENFAWRDGSSTWPVTRQRWIDWIKVLSATLHERNILLSATVPGESPEFQIPGVMGLMDLYAWADIAPYVDRLRLMAYDYSFDRPGPIGPQDWAARVLDLAVEQVGDANRSKVWLGVAQYGRDWLARDDNDHFITNADCPAGWTPNDTGFDTLVPDGAWSRAESVGSTLANGRLTWDATSKEWTYFYLARNVAGTTAGGARRTCNVRHEVWFSDTKSAVWHARLVAQYRIGGIAVWNLTDIMDDFYPELVTYAKTVAQVTTSVAMQGPRVAKFGNTITVSGTASSTKELPANAQASLYWSETSDGTVVKIADATTDATGTVSFRVPVERTGYWWIRVANSWWRLAGTSEPYLTRVHYAMTAAVTNSSPAVGQKVRIYTVIQPAVKGAPVLMQKMVKGEWVTIHQLTQSTGGGASAWFTPRVRTPVNFRFIALGTTGYIRTTSPVVTVTAH